MKQLLKDVETLSSDKYEGRKTGTKGAGMARSYIRDRFDAIGLKSFNTGYQSAFSFKSKNSADISGTNMVGYIAGKTDQVIVISAHYDHLGIVNNEIYNGADDNASGVAGLLYLAEYFMKNPPNNTLIFAAFDAEEMGLQGAKAFVAKPPVALSRIRLNINMDMISHNEKGELYVCGTFKYPELRKFFVVDHLNPKVLFGHDDPKQGIDDWTNQSDQGAFNAKNIPFLYFGVEDHKDYHKASDEYQSINKIFFENAVNAIRNIVGNIDKQRDIQKIFKERLKMKKR
ncbi:MAG TPA: M28 family peptidase [Pedobacter sp.]|uniref:M28 family peptidase n=1 Tax=Pedobacter sp. TaxID=1411316 RepID=UPI002C6AF72E|nr:M28 family peptidase [Pedobacter sp.]HMI00947.1 M28 family peptidase [Pedobacter sp.]